ncbi:MAG: hypothetical protein F7C08_00200 [Desulfurococcales archaeon]|nr:hypothetical protein [Desulfurococcales archaeon]MCE4604949.1 hypothetical protein [Desulfurococcales archaeon]
MRVKVTIDLRLLGELLASSGRRYVTVRQVSSMLGVSTRSAGRIMSMLEDMGYAVRFSERTYLLLDNSDLAVKKDGTPHSRPMKKYLASPR